MVVFDFMRATLSAAENIISILLRQPNPELDRLYSGHIVSIIEHSSIMKNNPVRIEANT